VALAVLSGAHPRELVAAIAAGDAARFQAVPGIGKRTAERIIVELREKVGGEDGLVAGMPGAGAGTEDSPQAPRALARQGLLGLGKTSLAQIVAAELGVDFVQTAGPALERKGDIASFLTALEPRSVFFVDEIHRLSRALEETFYPAMEDRRLPITVGQGVG